MENHVIATPLSGRHAGAFARLARRRCLGVAAILLLSFSLATTAQAATKHVLLLTSSERGFGPQAAFVDELRPDLIKASPDPIDLIEMSVQAARASGIAPDASVAERLESTFGTQHLDMVVTIGGPAATFGQEFRQQLFPTTPLLFAGVDRRFIENARLTPLDAAVATEHNAAPIIDEIGRLLPDTRTVMVVIGASNLEQFWLKELKQEFQRFDGRLRFIWTNDLSLAEMIEKAGTLPPHSAIFYALLSMDARGEPVVGQRAFAQLRASANAPMFGLYDTQLGNGIVGGRLLTTDELCDKTVSVAMRVLRGESPGATAATVEELGPPTYDWRELQRWKIAEDRLPSGSVVRFREPTIWQRYKGPIIAGATLASVQAAAAVVLLVGLVRRRQDPPSETIEESPLQPMTANASVRVWTAGPDGRRVETSHSTHAVSQATWASYVHPDDTARCFDIYRRSFERRQPFQVQYRIRRDSGNERWILDTGVPRFSGEEFLGYAGSAVDVTDLAVERTELSNLSRRLMLSHEREQAAVSKKLHDDVCQRIMMLTLRLHNLSTAPPDGGMKSGVEEVGEQLSGIASEIFTISDPVYHKLELLGLVAACRTLCGELSKTGGVMIHFQYDDIPDDLPADVSLALFRVLQEAVANAVRHSGAPDVWVSLRGASGEIQLDVTDLGSGFDPQRDVSQDRVGMVAMRERLTLVNGECTIESRPGDGTRVRASIPIRTELLAPPIERPDHLDLR
jgi:signal transduction histidine kinase